MITKKCKSYIPYNLCPYIIPVKYANELYSLHSAPNLTHTNTTLFMCTYLTIKHHMTLLISSPTHYVLKRNALLLLSNFHIGKKHKIPT